YFPSPNKQQPKILWIGCPDSRVLEADITVTKPGDVFVHKHSWVVVTSQFFPWDENALSVLQYSVGHLDVREVVVAGHKNCGGVITAYNTVSQLSRRGGPQNGTSPQNTLNRWLAPLAGRLKSLQPITREFAHDENVCIQVQNLLSLIQDILRWSKGEVVHVHGWPYDSTTGIIKQIVTEQIAPLENS
ncbi:hypothetical protein SCLCIDRAFT_119467, partial [Scleroderma citrinum Foug A]